MSAEKSFDQIAAEWRSYVEQLVFWALIHMRNRWDAYIWYLPPKRRSPDRKAVTVKKMPGREVLERHFTGASPGDVVALHSTSTYNTCRWIGIDLDCHSDDPILDVRNCRFAEHVQKILLSLGFQPLVLHSDGRGGFHVWILFSDWVEAKLAYRFAKWLVRDWKSFGIPEPETFPKQPCLSASTRYGCALRLPGRHHTRPYWSEVFASGELLQGSAACEAILATAGTPSTFIPAEARAFQTTDDIVRTMSIGPKRATPRGIILPHQTPVADAELSQRARRFLEKAPPAIERQRGDERLRDLIWAVLNTFRQLSVEQLFPLLLEWNQRCLPPFTEAEVWNKLSRAARKIG